MRPFSLFVPIDAHHVGPIGAGESMPLLLRCKDQVGYQYVADGGFTLLLSGGIGKITEDHRPQPDELLLGLGMGYTWR